jgi:sugar phosphate isomerase/epimerase
VKLGISTYTFAWAIGVPGNIPEKPMTAFGLIDKAAAYEVECVQIADNIPLHSFDQNYLEDLKKYADERSISIEIGTRGFTKENTLAYLKIAKFFGSPFLRMVIDKKDYHPDLDTVKQLIKELIPYFEKEKLVLAFENHDRFTSFQFKEIMECVKTDFLAICLDSVNSMGAGEGFREVCDLLLPYTINLHLKDFTIQRVFHNMGIEILGSPAGKGFLNVSELLEKSAKYKKCGSSILELWTPLHSNLRDTIALEQQWADESIVYLKSIIY